MKKIYLIIIGAFFIFLLIISIILSFKKKSSFSAGIPRQKSNEQIENISTISPVETADFKLQYSPQLNKIVVEKKTSQAEERLINWTNQNQLTQLIENPNLTLIIDQRKNSVDFNPLLELLNIFMNFGQGIGSLTQNQSVNQLPVPVINNQSPVTNNQSRVYYAQCNGFGKINLPNGCNLCQAGCGPTTVAMIAASYLGNNFTPKTIVDMYQSKGYPLGCAGSSYSDAKQALQDLGLKTTDYLVFNAEKSDTVVPELRSYLDAGWTFFAFARFCDDPKKGFCGHFFWITDIDNQNNVWAYDPAYSRYEIPYNENSRYPYPLYRLIFGVKKHE